MPTVRTASTARTASPGRPGRPGRNAIRALLALNLGYAAGTAGLGYAACTLAADLRPGRPELDPVLGLAASLLAWLVLTWLAVATAAEVLAAGTDGLRQSGRHPRAARWAPVVARRLAGVLLGAGLAGVATAAAPAGALTGRPVSSVTAPAVVGPTVENPAVASLGVDRPGRDLAGWTPDRPAVPATSRPSPVHLVASRPRPETAVEELVVVRRGDTLWDIAARRLGPGATAAEIAAEWPRWYAANRVVIGADPDLLRPGQRLQPPPA